MKRNGKSLLIFSVVLVVFALAVNVFATGSVNTYIAVSSSTLEVGDSLTVTVTASGNPGFNWFIGTFSYDSSILRLDSGSEQIELDNGRNGDTQSMSTSLTFTAIASGSCTISVSPNGAVDFDGNDLAASGSSTTITVVSNEPAPAPEDPEPEPQPVAPVTPTDPEEPEDPEEEEKITAKVDGKDYVILQDFSGVELPDGFGNYVFKYNGVETLGAIDQSGSVIIACLEDPSTNQRSFYLYDQYSEKFFPYVSVNEVAASYAIYPLENGMTVPEMFDITVNSYRGGTIPVWKSSDQKLEGIVLFYGRNAQGVKGFYMFDENTGAVQKLMLVDFDPTDDKKEVLEVKPAEPEKEPEKEEEVRSLYRRIMDDKQILSIVAILSALTVALLIAAIVGFSSRGRVSKQKFDKKMARKQKKFEKKISRNKPKNSGDVPELEIETEDFDSLNSDATASDDVPEVSETETKE